MGSTAVSKPRAWDPNPVKEMFREGEMLARFFFVQDPDGYKIEVIQQRGRYL